MSKGNMLLGHARGKVGSLVFSRANGQQITRARAEVVKNPQTEAQMIQRIILNTGSQAYSKMSEIVDHSFEGVQAGQPSMSLFLKRNLNLLRENLAAQGDFDAADVTFSPIGSNVFAVNDYIISKGSLPEVAPTSVEGALMSYAIAANTYQGILDATGLQRGDQLTFVVIEENQAGKVVFKFARVILDPTESDGSAAPLSSEFISNGAIAKPNAKNENNGLIFAFANNAISISVPGVLAAGAIIASRQKADGTWLRSDATLIASDSGLSVAYSMQDALDLFNAGGIDVVNPLYLNNASKRGSASVAKVTVSTKRLEGVTSVRGLGTYRVGEQVTLTAIPDNPSDTEIVWTEELSDGTQGPTLHTGLTYSFVASKNIQLNVQVF